MEKKPTLEIDTLVSSIDEAKELLEKLEVLEKDFEVNIRLSILSISYLFQVNPE